MRPPIDLSRRRLGSDDDDANTSSLSFWRSCRSQPWPSPGMIPDELNCHALIDRHACSAQALSWCQTGNHRLGRQVLLACSQRVAATQKLKIAKACHGRQHVIVTHHHHIAMRITRRIFVEAIAGSRRPADAANYCQRKADRPKNGSLLSTWPPRPTGLPSSPTRQPSRSQREKLVGYSSAQGCLLLLFLRVIAPSCDAIDC